MNGDGQIMSGESRIAIADRAIGASYGDRPVGTATLACPLGSTVRMAPDADHWVEFKLVDDADRPIAGEAYRLTLSDGRVIEGVLGESGSVRAEGIPAGFCSIEYPDLYHAMTATASPSDDAPSSHDNSLNGKSPSSGDETES
jgi:hypothetical protein